MTWRPVNGLFGKLFLSFTAVFLVTAFVVVGVWYFIQRPTFSAVGELTGSPPAVQGLESVASVLRFGGPQAAKAWLEEKRDHFDSTFYVTDAANRDLLGRTVPDTAVSQLTTILERSEQDGTPLPRFVKRVRYNDETYALFAVRILEAPALPKHLVHFPIRLTLTCALILIILTSWYLARRFTRPLEELNDAMRAFAGGALHTRIAEKLKNDDADVARLAVIFDDMAEEIQKLIDRQQRLFHDVSHEIRSPLARISVALALADRDLSRVPQSLARIEKEVAAVDTLVDDLLTYARFDAKTAFRFDDLRLDELVRDVDENLRFEAEAKNVSVHQTISEPMEFPHNRLILTRAFENVLRNALRHAPEGSSIDVTLTETETAVEWSCRDYGPGASEQEIQEMFQPFFRGEKQRSGTGFGLGLAIALRAAALHHGTIRAENANPGLRIVITMQK